MENLLWGLALVVVPVIGVVALSLFFDLTVEDED